MAYAVTVTVFTPRLAKLRPTTTKRHADFRVAIAAR